MYCHACGEGADAGAELMRTNLLFPYLCLKQHLIFRRQILSNWHVSNKPAVLSSPKARVLGLKLNPADKLGWKAQVA